MVGGKNRVEDILKTAAVTLAVSGTLFYVLGTMKDSEADLLVSSETYSYSADGIHIYTDAPETESTIPPASEHVIEFADDTAEAVPEETLLAESGAEAEKPSVPAVSETAVPVETDEGALNGAEQIAATVYWVKSGEVWHTTDKCSSLSRSKNILRGEIADAIASGKSRACKICGD